METNSIAKKFLWYCTLTLLSIPILFPIWMFIVRVFSNPTRWVREGTPPWFVDPSIDQFADAFNSDGFAGSFLWSGAMTLTITLAQLITSILAAYAFTFLEFPFRRTLNILCFATLLLPLEVTAIANSRIIRELGWNDSFMGLVAPFLASALGIFLLQQGFRGIPKDLRDAATLDGLGHLQFIRRVAVPVTRPIIASFAVIAALSAWNQYLWPSMVITDTEKIATTQIILKTISSDPNKLGLSAAAAALVSLPIVIALLLFQRQLVRGLTAGAVKG